jgi:ppGpp synthetase/RelA/SpoT-type nucleotidyltranferase
VLRPLANALEGHLRELCEREPRVDRVSARPKSVDRFLAKAGTLVNGKKKYSEPLRQIQDQLGARIITFYRSDVDRIAEVVQKYFHPIETRDVIPDSEWEFGYFGRHFILLVPTDVIDASMDRSLVPQFFELQIKTLFQHAWSEANHDLGYKPGGSALKSDEKRRLAFTSAQAWGADHIFDELFREHEQTS